MSVVVVIVVVIIIKHLACSFLHNQAQFILNFKKIINHFAIEICLSVPNLFFSFSRQIPLLFMKLRSWLLTSMERATPPCALCRSRRQWRNQVPDATHLFTPTHSNILTHIDCVYVCIVFLQC